MRLECTEDCISYLRVLEGQVINIETETPSYNGDGSHHLLLGTVGPKVQYHKLAIYAES